MIGVFEKILWGTSLLLVFLAVLVVVFAGPPTMTPRIQGQGGAVSEAKFFEQMPREWVKDVKAYIEKGPPPAPGEEGKKKSRRPNKPKELYRQVDRAVFDRISNLSRATSEIRHANSRPKKKDGKVIGLEIYDFDKSHTLSKLGFEEKDIIEVIDGQRIDYSPSAARALFYSSREKMARGEPIIVDLKRNGKPVRLFFTIQ